MIPDRVREAAEKALRVRPPHAGEAPTAMVGEIDVAESSKVAASGIRRLVVVLERDDVGGTVTILLISNETEYATDLELIVDMTEAGLPYQSMIQSELYGPLFVEQLQDRVGSVDKKQLLAVAEALATDGESLEGYPTGLPLGDRSDPRRTFKNRELADLELLVAECRGWMLGELADLRLLDPELLIPPPPGTAISEVEDQFLELLDVVDALGEPISIRSGLLDALSDTDFLDEFARWRRDFGIDASRVLDPRVIDEDIPEVRSSSDHATSDRRTSTALNDYVEVQAERGYRMIDIHTVGRCWAGQPEVRRVESTSGSSCRARGRVLEAA